ncbi:MAG: hypothetical protein ABFD92_21025 [Planctomycetaceae bacterium]
MPSHTATEKETPTYQALVLQALKHARSWMRYLGLTAEQRRAVWKMMMEGER